ncbi:probable terpene synthase 8 [Ricinus communis]|uniref:Probable terpene synthase 8 n=1 Tax=Ricinus communis TaxID=3988 RepID=TPS8_RICCO|nr:probable terpene synthase 8 [Ricinus communis]B9S1N2.1 RecName: Full=Probable terpene synthase 8; Short=RcSeTPS8 [Ricinus communis]EEF42501.1 Casbene synthase, chloroplast precursor, putative [Ricinus communis]|eukprot:XP_025013246.1 probable terpene synthase 8 [Ricinus communis]
MAAEAKNDEQQDIARRLAKFPSTIWGCSFASFSLKDSEIESYTQQVEELKGKVKDMLMQSTKEITQNIEVINLLCRLGVSYHFESEIEQQLNLIFASLPSFLNDNGHLDLYTVALLFRVLRQHGRKVPCDVFNKYKDDNGEFKKDITSDVKGLLSLYEASVVSVHGEEILDEALVFTKQHLETLAAQVSPHFEQHIRNALLCPVHYGMERLQARLYISFYEEDESRNEILLKFAKLDFNRLQLLYREELAIVSRWWKDLDLTERLSYARDRIVEVYVWALGCVGSQPQFASSRLLVAKFTQTAMTVDDTYDAYGTIGELRLFTAAFERCSIDAIHELPEYMQYLYKAILKLFEETENDANEGSSYKTSYAKEMFKELTRADLQEGEWFNSLYVPAFDEYLHNASITTTGELLTAAFLLGLKEASMKEIVWVRDAPKIVRNAKLFARLLDDVATHEEEQKRGDCPSSVECYMNEYGVPKEKAYEEIKKILATSWKDINEDYMKQHRVSRTVVNYFINFARMSNFVYKVRDAYTYSTHLKTYVATLFLQPLPV